MYIRDGVQPYKSTYSPHLICPIRSPVLCMSKPFCPWCLLQPFWLLAGMLFSTGWAVCQDSVQMHSLLWNPFKYQYVFIICTFQLSNSHPVVYLVLSYSSRNDNSFEISLVLPLNSTTTIPIVAIGLLFGVRLQETFLLKNHLKVLK